MLTELPDLALMLRDTSEEPLTVAELGLARRSARELLSVGVCDADDLRALGWTGLLSLRLTGATTSDAMRLWGLPHEDTTDAENALLIANLDSFIDADPPDLDGWMKAQQQQEEHARQRLRAVEAKLRPWGVAADDIRHRLEFETGEALVMWSQSGSVADAEVVFVSRLSGPECMTAARTPTERAQAVRLHLLDDKTRTIVDMRSEGRTYDEIGRTVGVTRERIRQILSESGIRIDAASRRADRLKAEGLSDAPRLIELFRAGEDISSIARLTGHAAEVVQTVLSEVASQLDRKSRIYAQLRGRHVVKKQYSDEDMLDGIRWITNELGHTPSTQEYNELAVSYGLASLPTVHNRLGSWRKAVEAAGLSTAGSGPGNRNRRWTETRCWAALDGLLGGADDFPTVQQYELLASLDDELPSSATVRNRCGPWSDVRLMVTARRMVIDALPPDAATLDDVRRADLVATSWLEDELTDDDVWVLEATGWFKWRDAFGPKPWEGEA